VTRPNAQTEYSAITIIVVKASLQQQAENAAIAADPEGGAGTFVPGVPLRLAGDESNTPVAYWCQWNMKPQQRSAFASNMGGPINVLAPGASVPLNRDRWLFEASGEGAWTGEQVLAALGYAPLGSTPLPN
jgi:hypothetical protein